METKWKTLLILLVTLFIVTAISAQNLMPMPQQKNSFGTTKKSIENSQTKLNKVIISNSTDTLRDVSNELLKVVCATTNNLLDLLNKYKRINLTYEHPLKINLSHITDGPIKISEDYNQLKIQGNINLKWFLTFGIVGNVTTTFGILSNIDDKTGGNYKEMIAYGDPFEYLRSIKKEKDSMYDLSQSEAFIKSGDVNIEGQYFLNGIVIFFETGSISLSSWGSLGEFSNSTILNYNGIKYLYSSKVWIKQ